MSTYEFYATSAVPHQYHAVKDDTHLPLVTDQEVKSQHEIMVDRAFACMIVGIFVPPVALANICLHSKVGHQQDSPLILQFVKMSAFSLLIWCFIAVLLLLRHYGVSYRL